jgi:hypothetical protein
MRKTLIIFIFIFCSMSFFSCIKEPEDIDSTLIVKNLPSGQYFVSVYNTNISSEELKEKYTRSTGYIALANGYSPFTLIWYVTISSGDKYVIIKKNSNDFMSPNTYKINIVNFTKEGDATVDWNDMIDYYPY